MSITADIRNKAVELLIAANIADAKIFNSKRLPATLSVLPAICVYTDQVKATQEAARLPAFVCQVHLEIDVIVNQSSTWADAAEEIVQTVIDTLMNNVEWREMFDHIEGYQVAYGLVSELQSPLAMGIITIVGSVLQAYSE